MTEPIYDYDPADSLVDSETVAVFFDAYDTGDAAFTFAEFKVTLLCVDKNQHTV